MDGDANAYLHNYKIRIYDIFMVICGLAVFAVNLSKVNVSGWKEVTVFIVMYFFSQLLPARLPQGDVFSVTIFVDLALIVIFGTPLAVIVGFGVTFITKFIFAIFGRKEAISSIFRVTAQNALVIGMAGIVYTHVNNKMFAFVLASVVYFASNVFFLYINSVLSNKALNARWLSVIKMLYINYIVLSVMAFIMTTIYHSTASQWKLFDILLFFVPILLVSHSFRLYIDIKQSYINTVKTIVAAIEANDSYTKGHSERVAELVLAVGKKIKIPERELQKLEYVTFLHDVGKIGISEDILNKPGRLSTEEYEEVKGHSLIGAEILQKIKFLSSKSDIILYHHERYDGSGYPAGLKGDNIPLEARILAIVDTYDAMTTDRPYRSAKTPAQAVQELSQLSGELYDPKLVEVFKSVLRSMGEI